MTKLSLIIATSFIVQVRDYRKQNQQIVTASSVIVIVLVFVFIFVLLVDLYQKHHTIVHNGHQSAIDFRRKSSETHR